VKYLIPFLLALLFAHGVARAAETVTPADLAAFARPGTLAAYPSSCRALVDYIAETPRSPVPIEARTQDMTIEELAFPCVTMVKNYNLRLTIKVPDALLSAACRRVRLADYCAGR
jgi:hypothetical protein